MYVYLEREMSQNIEYNIRTKKQRYWRPTLKVTNPLITFISSAFLLQLYHFNLIWNPVQGYFQKLQYSQFQVVRNHSVNRQGWRATEYGLASNTCNTVHKYSPKNSFLVGQLSTLKLFVHTLYSILYMHGSILYTVHCTCMAPYSIQYTVHAWVHTLYSTLYMHGSILYTVYCTCMGPYTIQYTVHAWVHTLYSIL